MNTHSHNNNHSLQQPRQPRLLQPLTTTTTTHYNNHSLQPQPQPRTTTTTTHYSSTLLATVGSYRWVLAFTTHSHNNNNNHSLQQTLQPRLLQPLTTTTTTHYNNHSLQPQPQPRTTTTTTHYNSTLLATVGSYRWALAFTTHSHNNKTATTHYNNHDYYNHSLQPQPLTTTNITSRYTALHYTHLRHRTHPVHTVKH